MLCRTLFLIVMSTPLCAGGGVIEEPAVRPSDQAAEVFHQGVIAIKERAKRQKFEKHERKQAVLEDSPGRPLVEVLPPPPKVLKPSQRELERKVQRANVQAKPRQKSENPEPHPLGQIPEEVLISQEDPYEVPEQPQVASQSTPGTPQISRGGGSLLGLATVGFVALCYNGYQKRHKRPSHNILNEKAPSKGHFPIFTQQ